MAVIDPWIDAELRNWARWCHSGQLPHPIPPSHCRSIEHRYIAPSDLGRELDAEEIARRIPIIRDRAEIVHRVYLERLTDRERQAVKLRYVKLRYVKRDGAPWQRMRIGQAAYEAALITVARLVGEAFRELKLTA